MKKFTSGFAVFAFSAMVVTSAFAQAGGGAAGGAAAGASGSGGVSAPSTGAAGSTTGAPGSGSTAPGTGTSPQVGDAKSKAETKGAGNAANPSATGPGSSSTTTSPPASPSTTTTPSMTTASGDFTARHTMEGQVVSVNEKKGHLKLKTAEGTMELHFPPSALAGVKKGDRIAVELAMKP